MGEWISTNEKLPPIGKQVLAIIEYDYMEKHYSVYGIVSLFSNGNFAPLGRMTDQVTHWMPLPDLPTTKQSNK